MMKITVMILFTVACFFVIDKNEKQVALEDTESTKFEVITEYQNSVVPWIEDNIGVNKKYFYRILDNSIIQAFETRYDPKMFFLFEQENFEIILCLLHSKDAQVTDLFFRHQINKSLFLEERLEYLRFKFKQSKHRFNVPTVFELNVLCEDVYGYSMIDDAKDPSL